MTFYINCQIVPQSKKQQITKLKDKYYKVKLVSVPEKGRANRELISLLSSYFKMPRSSFTITSGLTSSTKLIKIQDDNYSR